MQVEFSYTFDDLQEGFVPEAHARNPRRFRGRITFAAVPWTLALVMLGLVMWMQSTTADRRRVLPHDVVSEMVPNDVAAGFLCAAVLVLAGSSWKKAHRRTPAAKGPAKKLSAGQRLIVVLVVVAFVFPSVLLAARPAWTWYATREELLLANCAPWVVVFVVFLVFTVAHSRWALRRQWFSDPAWERRTIIEIDETGVRMSNSLTDVYFAWGYFPRAWETANLLVLLCENGGRVIIPKRAFPGTPDVEQARALMQNKIASTNFLVKPGGFPVAPIPAIPLERARDL